MPTESFGETKDGLDNCTYARRVNVIKWQMTEYLGMTLCVGCTGPWRALVVLPRWSGNSHV